MQTNAGIYLGRRISVLSGDDREHLFLFQCISVAIQQFNVVLLHDGSPLRTTRTSVSTSNFLIFPTLVLQGFKNYNNI